MEKPKGEQAWRQAVQEQMRLATEEEAQRRYGTTKPSFNYRWEHVTAVVTLALKLAKQTGADRDVVEAAAWLHDVRKGFGENHPQEGAKFAQQFLLQTDFPRHKINQVARAIADHMGLWLEEPLQYLEAQVLWDADKLAKIGLTAALHWTCNDIARGKSNYNTQDIISRGRAQDWLPKTVRSMHTKPARKAARKRLKRYQKLWRQLEKELNGDDLED